MELKPIDDFVFQGFQQRFKQQFDCPAYLVTTNEQATIAQIAKGGEPLTYPYAFITPGTSGPNTESYVANRLARHGLVAVVEDNQLVGHRVRLMPTNFDVEVKYVTNEYQSTKQGSVTAFQRRWLFARRTGSLQYNIRYGRISVGIQVTLSDSVPFTPRENAPDSETAYQVVTSATIHGYISEPVTGTVGIVQQVALQELLEAEGLSGGQFFPFT